MATQPLRLPLSRPCPDGRTRRSASNARRVILRDVPAPSLTDLFGAHWLPDTLDGSPPRKGAPYGR